MSRLELLMAPEDGARDCADGVEFLDRAAFELIEHSTLGASRGGRSGLVERSLDVRRQDAVKLLDRGLAVVAAHLGQDVGERASHRQKRPLDLDLGLGHGVVPSQLMPTAYTAAVWSALRSSTNVQGRIA